jgi:LiaI-LiaF-like transmembrane region
MNLEGINRTSLVAGLVFIVLGALFLLDQLDVLRLRAAYVVPVILIVLGVVVVGGALSPYWRRSKSPS